MSIPIGVPVGPKAKKKSKDILRPLKTHTVLHKMECYCGEVFSPGEGWGMFHSQPCGEQFRRLGYFDLAAYQNRGGA
jgi:hypothetical protein